MTVAPKEDVGGASFAYLTLSHKIISPQLPRPSLLKLEWLSEHFENSLGQKGTLLTRLLIQESEQLSFLLCSKFFVQDQYIVCLSKQRVSSHAHYLFVLCYLHFPFCDKTDSKKAILFFFVEKYSMSAPQEYDQRLILKMQVKNCNIILQPRWTFVFLDIHVDTKAHF